MHGYVNDCKINGILTVLWTMGMMVKWMIMYVSIYGLIMVAHDCMFMEIGKGNGKWVMGIVKCKMWTMVMPLIISVLIMI